jgi:hypothetical protein
MDILNVSLRPLDWTRDTAGSSFLIGDMLAISSDQIVGHGLHPVTQFTDLAGDTVLQVVQPSKP